MCRSVEDAQVQRQEHADEHQEGDPEDQVHVWEMVFLSGPERIGGRVAQDPDGIRWPGICARPWGRGPRAGEDREPGGRRAGRGHAERTLRSRRTRSTMGGWVLNRVVAPPARGLTVYRCAMAAGTGRWATGRRDTGYADDHEPASVVVDMVRRCCLGCRISAIETTPASSTGCARRTRHRSRRGGRPGSGGERPGGPSPSWNDSWPRSPLAAPGWARRTWSGCARRVPPPPARAGRSPRPSTHT